MTDRAISRNSPKRPALAGGVFSAWTRYALLVGVLLLAGPGEAATLNFVEDFQDENWDQWDAFGYHTADPDEPENIVFLVMNSGGRLHFKTGDMRAFEGNYETTGADYLIFDLRHGGSGEDVVLRAMVWDETNQDVSASDTAITLTAADTDFRTCVIPIDSNSMTWVTGDGKYATDAEPRLNVERLSLRHNPDQTGPGYQQTTTGSFYIDNIRLSATPEPGPLPESEQLSVLMFSATYSDTGYGMSPALELQSIFVHCDSHWRSLAYDASIVAGSLLEAYHNPYASETCRSILSASDDVVVFAGHGPFADAAPEMLFEGVMQVSNLALENGARPLLLTNPYPYGDIDVMGENAYRTANGCGIETVPASYALDALGLIDPGAELDQARFNYVVAAMLFYQITGLDACQDTSYVPTVGGTPLDYQTLCSTAIQTADNRLNATQYTGSRQLVGGVRYRPFDPSLSPLNGTVRYARKGTSTENGISAHISPILQANGYTASPHFVSSVTEGTKWWNATDFDLAAPYFAANPHQVLLTYARGCLDSAQKLIDAQQSNMMPTIFDRHYDSIGTGLDSTWNVMDDVHASCSWVSSSAAYYGWTYVPFHIAACRLYQADPTVIASADGTHVTTPFYTLIVSMMLTSIMGDGFGPTTAILADTQSMTAFDIGKTLIKQLAFLSETGTHIPDSNLRLTPTALPGCIRGEYAEIQLAAQGGTLPYAWELTLGTALPEGLALDPDGVVSGTATSAPGAYDFVVRLEDASGAFRKVPLRLDIHTAGEIEVVYLDFTLGDDQNAGANRLYPVKTLARAGARVAAQGTIRIEAGESSETIRIGSSMRLESTGGIVRIGTLGARRQERFFSAMRRTMRVSW